MPKKIPIHSLQDAEREFVRAENRLSEQRRFVDDMARRGESEYAEHFINASQYARSNEFKRLTDSQKVHQLLAIAHFYMNFYTPRHDAIYAQLAIPKHVRSIPPESSRQYKAGTEAVRRWSERNRSLSQALKQAKADFMDARDALLSSRQFRQHFADRDGKAAQYAGLIAYLNSEDFRKLKEETKVERLRKATTYLKHFENQDGSDIVPKKHRKEYKPRANPRMSREEITRQFRQKSLKAQRRRERRSPPKLRPRPPETMGDVIILPNKKN